MGLQEQVIEIAKDLGKVEAAAKQAHSRLDSLEHLFREDLHNAVSKIENITAWMNHQKGWFAAAMLFASIIGGAITAGATLLIK